MIAVAVCRMYFIALGAIMIDIQLQCGRTVDIRAIYVDQTYFIVMEGHASAEVNQRVMNHHRDFLRSAVGVAPIALVDSSGAPLTIHAEKLPQLRYASFLVSNDPTKHSSGMGSDLIVVWFEEQFQAIDRAYLAAKLSRIDWDTYARNFDW